MRKNSKVSNKKISEESKLFRDRFYEKSEITQEIVTKKPSSWEKRALISFLILITILLSIAWFVKYPDTIEGRAILRGSNNPKEIISKQSGKIIAIFVENNQEVKEGEVICWLETTASTKDVIELSNIIDSSLLLLETSSPIEVSQLFNKRFRNLGEIQSDYEIFTASLQQYNDYFVNGFYESYTAAQMRDILSMEKMKEKNLIQKKILEDENKLARETFKMYESLYKENVISMEEYRQAETDLLKKQISIPQIDIAILSQQNQIRSMKNKISEINHNFQQQKRIFEQALSTLKSEVSEWIKKYVIQSPVSGNIIFAFAVQENLYVTQGVLLGHVIPSNNKYYADIKLRQNNFGKIDTGMEVHLRLDAYPYQEVGFVKGRLDFISRISIDSTFLGTVDLGNSLVTNQNKQLQYKSGLTAKATVITKDMRLLEKIFRNIINY